MRTIEQQLARPTPMPILSQLLAHESRPGVVPSPPPAAGNNMGLLAALGRTLNGLPVRAPLPAQRPAPAVPAVAPPAAQPAGAMPQGDGFEIAKANMLPLFRRLHQLIGGELTLNEKILVNQVAWQIGREATNQEIEALAQYLAKKFEPASAVPLMSTESS